MSGSNFMRIEGREYRFPRSFVVLLRIISFGMFDMLCRQSLKLKIFILTKKVCVKHADLILATSENNHLELCKVKTIFFPHTTKNLQRYVRTKHLKYFDAMCKRFFFDTVSQKYVLHPSLSKTNNSLELEIKEKKVNHKFPKKFVEEFVARNPDFVKDIDETALIDKNLLEMHVLYGRNSTALKPETPFQIFKRLICDPLLIYTIFGVVLWCFIDYMQYAILIGALTLYSFISDFLLESKKAKNVKKLSNNEKEVTVYRNGWRKIKATEIYPGDIIKVEPIPDFVADVQILSGEVVADESFLTGETVPIVKNAESAGNIIYSGTKILTSFGSFVDDPVVESSADRIRLQNIRKKTARGSKAHSEAKNSPFYAQSRNNSMVKLNKTLSVSNNDKSTKHCTMFNANIVHKLENDKSHSSHVSSSGTFRDINDNLQSDSATSLIDATFHKESRHEVNDGSPTTFCGFDDNSHDSERIQREDNIQTTSYDISLDQNRDFVCDFGHDRQIDLDLQDSIINLEHHPPILKMKSDSFCHVEARNHKNVKHSDIDGFKNELPYQSLNSTCQKMHSFEAENKKQKENLHNEIQKNSKECVEFHDISNNADIHQNLVNTSVDYTEKQMPNSDSFNCAVGIVISTGFNTCKGSLIRNIILPKHIDFVFYKQSARIVAFLFLLGLFAAVPMLGVFLKKEVVFKDAFFYSLDLILCLLSPALPTTIKVGSSLAAKRLKKRKIAVSDTNHINLAGTATMCIFDKTGTLTSEGLDVFCIDNIENEFFYPEQLNYIYLEALATCHTISLIGDELAGDPLDVKMFMFSGAAVLQEKGRKIGIAYDYNKFLMAHSAIMEAEDYDENTVNRKESAELENDCDRNVRDCEICACENQKHMDSCVNGEIHAYNHYSEYQDIIDDVLPPKDSSVMHKKSCISDSGSSASHSRLKDSYDEIIRKEQTNEEDAIVFCKQKSEKFFENTDTVEVMRIFEFDSKLRRMGIIVKTNVQKYIKKEIELFYLDKNIKTCARKTSIPYIICNNEIITVNCLDTIENQQNEISHSLSTQNNQDSASKFSECEYPYMFYVKGSPESIQPLLREVPEDYEDIVKDYALEGYRIIACAYKPVVRCDHDRNFYDKDLNFLCFIVFANRLKKETKSSLKMLNSANIKIRMATGDNILTAISVARQSKMIDKYVPVIFPIVDEKAKSIFDAQWLCLSDEDLMFDKIKLTLHKGEDRISYNEFIVACEGREYEFFKKESKEYFDFILQKGVVFARMNPDQKKMLVEDLNSVGNVTLFCGDGANDCGALTAANIGISLAGNESSIASNFTSTKKDISVAIDLIKEGRAALVTSTSQFLFILASSILQFISLILLSSNLLFLSDLQTMYTDFIVIMLIAQIMNTFSVSKNLCIRLPETKIWTRNSCIIIGLWMITCTVAYALCFYFFDIETQNTSFLKNSKIGTCFFFLQNLQIVLMGLFLAVGHPHRQTRFSNRKFIICMAFNFVINFSILAIAADHGYIQYINQKFEFARLSINESITLFCVTTLNLLALAGIYWFINRKTDKDISSNKNFNLDSDTEGSENS